MFLSKLKRKALTICRIIFHDIIFLSSIWKGKLAYFNCVPVVAFMMIIARNTTFLPTLSSGLYALLRNVLGPLLFLLYINNIKSVSIFTLKLFGGDSYVIGLPLFIDHLNIPSSV